MSRLLEISTGLCDIAKEMGDQGLLQKSIFLRQRIAVKEGYLLFLGESCSGKSLLINSLIGEPLLPVKGIPSTAAITEVRLDAKVSEPQYAVINRNATMEKLSFEKFQALTLEPDTQVNRMRAVLPDNDRNLSGICFFDTPGYGSLIREHDEALMDFLPNCDIAVYIISYKVGLQEVDYQFLKEMLELTHPNTPLYLVINRCPTGIGKKDCRIHEVYEIVSGLLQRPNLPLILVSSLQTESGILAGNEIDALRDRLRTDLQTPERVKAVEEAHKQFLRELADMLQLKLQQKQIQLNSDEEAYRIFREETNANADKLLIAIDKIIRPGFKRIRSQMSKRMDEVCQQIESRVCSEIDRQSAATKDETTAYVKTHLLPFNSEEGAKNIHHYLSAELDEIDRQVQDYLNTVIAAYERDIQLRFATSNAIKAGAGIVKDMIGRMMNSSLLVFFAKYGGAGGAGAGMANAASHLLKRIGGLFNHTFSRETHNALKHIMKKLCLTNSKILGPAISATLELVSAAVDVTTWKGSLKKGIHKGMAEWKEESIRLFTEELDKLEEQNIASIQQCSEAFRNCCVDTQDDNATLQQTEILLNRVINIQKELV